MHDTSPWPPDLAGTLTQWPWPIFGAPVTTQFTLTFQIFSTIKPTTTKPCTTPRCTDSAGTLTRWPLPIFCAPVTLTHFESTFAISSTIRPTTIKTCKVLLLNALTRQIPWPGDLDLYFGCCDFDITYVNVPDLKCNTSNHQTLHSASPRCTDTASVLIQWPWPIFCAPVPFTHFTLTFNISSTIRPTTTKPCIVLLLNVWTLQVPWLGDLRPTATKPCIVLHLIVLAWEVPWRGDLVLYLTHFTLMFNNSSTIRPTTTISCIVLLLDVQIYKRKG